jgi:hypothetical protein
LLTFTVDPADTNMNELDGDTVPLNSVIALRDVTFHMP